MKRRHSAIVALLCAVSTIMLSSCASDDGYTSKNEIAASTDKHQALEDAQRYIDQIAVSEQGVRNLLEYHKYSVDAVDYAIDNLDADYNEEARQSMENYRDDIELSKEETKQTLLDEGFSKDSVAYAMLHY